MHLFIPSVVLARNSLVSDLAAPTTSTPVSTVGTSVRGVLGWIAKVLSVAVGCYLFGRIGLLLEVESQHTCAAWPAAGFALGALIVCGWRVWPGVLLGACCVNPSSGFDAPTGSAASGLAPADALIAIGCTLQGLVGFALMKRFVGIPAPLLERGVIARFLLVGGPLAAMISSTIGTAALFAAGIIAQDELLFTCCTWWVGDVLGIVCVTSIFLIAFGEPRAAWRPRLVTVGVPIVLAFAIAAASFVFARNDAAKAEFHSSGDGSQFVDRIHDKGFIPLEHTGAFAGPAAAVTSGRLTQSRESQKMAAAWHFWSVNIVGLALVAVLSGIVLSLTGSQIRSELTVADRASEVENARATTEAALREVESFCTALNEHSLISIADPKGRIIEVNEQFCLLSGYTREELIGCDHRIINSGCHPKQFWVEVWRTLATGRAWRGEICNRAKNGELYWVESIIAPFKGRDGKIQRFISIRTDVTARKKGELALASLNALFEAKNSELAAMAERAHRVVDDVSHEFRTPLAVIKEFASIITDGLAGPVSVKQSEYLRIMDGAVIDLNHMVEDLLDSSKLRVGRLRVDRRAHTVEEIVAVGRPALQRKAAVRSIVIEEQIEPGLPCVFADEEKVRRVISNFMTNAIKFTPDGGKIELSAHRSARSGEVVISVTDHGPGLTHEDMECLFGRFRQVSTARAVAAKGFGLGLSIAQELAWLSLGRISVESERGKATTFSVALPTNDPESLITHYFETIAASDRAEDELALLRVTLLDSRHRATGTSAQQDPFEIDAFLASITYAADLVIPVPDESAGLELDSKARAWLIVGRTRSTKSWMERIRKARAIAIAESEFQLGMLRVELESSWEFPAQADEAQAQVIAIVTKGLVPLEL